MRYLLLIFTILIVSCSEAESILERGDSESDSSNPSNEAIDSTNDDLKSLEERITKLESTIENNSLALENLTKSISSSTIVVQSDNLSEENSEKTDGTNFYIDGYGRTADNPVVENIPLIMNTVEDLRGTLLSGINEIEIYVSSMQSEIIFEGLDEVIHASESNFTFINTDNTPFITNKGDKITLPKRFRLGLNMSQNKGIIKLEHKYIHDYEADVGLGAMFDGLIFEFEYHVIFSSK